MGFWYFLILFIGIYLFFNALVKRTYKTGKKVAVLAVGACMISFSIFMFQDGSAEIVDSILKSLRINL